MAQETQKSNLRCRLASVCQAFRVRPLCFALEELTLRFVILGRLFPGKRITNLSLHFSASSDQSRRKIQPSDKGSGSPLLMFPKGVTQDLQPCPPPLAGEEYPRCPPSRESVHLAATSGGGCREALPWASAGLAGYDCSSSGVALPRDPRFWGLFPSWVVWLPSAAGLISLGLETPVGLAWLPAKWFSCCPSKARGRVWGGSFNETGSRPLTVPLNKVVGIGHL